MKNNRRMTLANNNIVVEYTNERIIPAGGLAVVGAILGKSDFTKRLNRMDVTEKRSQHQIKNGDIILTYIGMLCMGKPYFEAVHEMDDDKEKDDGECRTEFEDAHALWFFHVNTSSWEF